MLRADTRRCRRRFRRTPAIASRRPVRDGGDGGLATEEVRMTGTVVTAADAVGGVDPADLAGPGPGAVPAEAVVPEAVVPEAVVPDAPAARRPRSLSPSRAADFKTCPLLY